MLKQIPFAESVGKTVKATHVGETWVITVYEDGTFSWLSPDCGYDGDIDIEDEEFPDVTSIDPGFVISSGLATQAEIDAILEKQRTQIAEIEERRLRQDYERLKARFEGQSE